jgi:hypothetical protein
MYVSYRFVMWCLSVRGGGGKKKDLRVGEVKERYQEKCNKKTHGSHESNPNQDLPSIQDQVRPDRRSDKTATKVSKERSASDQGYYFLSLSIQTNNQSPDQEEDMETSISKE